VFRMVYLLPMGVVASFFAIIAWMSQPKNKTILRAFNRVIKTGTEVKSF